MLSEDGHGKVNLHLDLCGFVVSRIVAILGMHRSGTSCLAGSLEEAGLYLGDVSTSGRHNAKGNRENSRIMALHEAVLDYSGGSWERPPAHVRWSAAHRAERDDIIRSYAEVPAWGFKDPRTVLLVNFWQEAISDLIFVGTLRHPRAVAESLLRRGNGLVNDWLDLWRSYNDRMLSLYKMEPFSIVSFDCGEASYRRSLAVVLDHLSLPEPARMGFFDPTLRHHETFQMDALPESVADLYRLLCCSVLDP